MNQIEVAEYIINADRIIYIKEIKSTVEIAFSQTEIIILNGTEAADFLKAFRVLSMP